MKYELFVYKDAESILSEKNLLGETRSILDKIKTVKHMEIQAEFYKRGWEVEKRIFQGTSWAWDAFKKKVAVSVELSLIDAVHRDFLRAILAHKRELFDTLLYVTSTNREPKFHNVKRDISIFEELLTFPIYLVGLR